MLKGIAEKPYEVTDLFGLRALNQDESQQLEENAPHARQFKQRPTAHALYASNLNFIKGKNGRILLYMYVHQQDRRFIPIRRKYAKPTIARCDDLV